MSFSVLVLVGTWIGVAAIWGHTFHVWRRVLRARRSSTVVMLGGRVIGTCEMVRVPPGSSLSINVLCDREPESGDMCVRAITLAPEDGRPSGRVVSNN